MYLEFRQFHGKIVKKSFFAGSFPNFNHSIQHFHGKSYFLFTRANAFMYVDLSLSFFICGKNVLREFAILIMGDQKSRKVNKYQNIFAILKTATVYFPCLKKEPHPKVIIASCATYQLWLKVTIKILPTIFFLSSAWYRTWWWLRGFLQGVERPTYFGGLLSSDVIQTKTPTVTHI